MPVTVVSGGTTPPHYELPTYSFYARGMIDSTKSQCHQYNTSTEIRANKRSVCFLTPQQRKHPNTGVGLRRATAVPGVVIPSTTAADRLHASIDPRALLLSASLSSCPSAAKPVQSPSVLRKPCRNGGNWESRAHCSTHDASDFKPRRQKRMPIDTGEWYRSLRSI